MLAKNSGEKHFVAILIFILLFVGALVIMSSAQSETPISAAPGQAVMDYITLGAESQNEISITLPTFESFAFSPKNSPCTMLSSTPLVVNSINSGASGWSISVSAVTNGGSLAEYDLSASQYVSNGEILRTPLKIIAEGGNEVDLSNGGVLIQKVGANTPASVPLTLSQDVTWQDKALHNGHVYRIEISFVASAVY